MTRLLGIRDLGLGIRAVTRVALALAVLVSVALDAQAPANPTNRANPTNFPNPTNRPNPTEVSVPPIECWWKTDRSAVRVGEHFALTLTCAVLDTDRVKVVVDESSLAPSALHLTPFEIVDGQRFRDIQNSPRRFFQYQYIMRVLGEEFFGKEITLPRLQISYRVQNSLSGGSALAGREEQYSLRPVPVRILSLVPRDATDIRDTPADTFGEIDARLFRSNLLLILATVAFAFAGLMAVLLIARAAVNRRAAVAAKRRVVSPGLVLRAASGELSRVRKASEQEGWTTELAGRAAAALRLAGAVALAHPIGQRELDPATTPSEGQIVVGRGIRGRKVVLSAAVTPRDTNGASASPLWHGISQSLSVFTAARYSRNGGVDSTALDAALAEGEDLIKRLRLFQWRRIGRSKPHAVSETGKQTWVR